MDDSLERKNPTNPMLLCPVIRCVFELLDIEDIKNCRLVCREWGSTGKLALGSRGIIHLHKDNNQGEAVRGLVEFLSCFLDSVRVFSAYKISGVLTDKNPESNHWTAEELTPFFEEHQKYIKKLTLKLKRSKEKDVKMIDLSSWISQSPMVKKDTKYLTKLTIDGEGKILEIPSLHLIAHIKELTLSNCRVTLEGGIKICPIKLTLTDTAFFRDGIKLNSVRINDFVDFSKMEALNCTTPLGTQAQEENTKYVLDLFGNNTLDNLVLTSCEILNGGTSHWVIDDLVMFNIPYSLNSEMKINLLYLCDVGTIDLFTLPNSVKNLDIHDIGHGRGTTVNCSQPIVLENLGNLQISNGRTEDYSFLSHFKNCPQLTFLKFEGCNKVEIKSSWMPKCLKTLISLDDTLIKWVDESDSYFNLEKLVLYDSFLTDKAKDICKSKIPVNDVVIYCYCFQMNLDKYKALVRFLQDRKRFSFGKRLFIGELRWCENQFVDSGMKEYVDEKSSYYVFENEQKGRAFSKKCFLDLTSDLF